MTYKYSKPRCNLSELDDEIKQMEQDHAWMMRKGQTEEAVYLNKRIQELRGVKSRAINSGFGYYEYKTTSNLGVKLVLAVAFALGLLLFAGWFMVVLK